MKAANLTRKEMIKESRRIYRNLSNRLGRIREMENVPQYALNKFRELQEKYPRNIEELTDKELRTYYRQLKYIDNLKSSRVSNLKSIKENFDPIKSALSVMSKNAQNKFWDIYKKIYEEGISDAYKYDVMQFAMARYLYEGDDPEEIENTIIELYNKLKREIPDNEEEFSIRFTDELNDLL